MFSPKFDEEAVKYPAGYVLFETKKSPKRKLYWLDDGHAIEYAPTEKGWEVLRFLDSKQLILASSAYNKIETTGVCTVVHITFENIVKMLKSHPDTAKLHRIIKTEHLKKVKEHEIELTTMTPAERYMQLLEKQPWVKTEIKSKLIASYLRIDLQQYENMCALN